jgi:arylsulfatase
MIMLGRIVLAAVTATCAMLPGSLTLAQPAAASKPNILVIMADDIGYWNISAYNRGQMRWRRIQGHRE